MQDDAPRIRGPKQPICKKACNCVSKRQASERWNKQGRRCRNNQTPGADQARADVAFILRTDQEMPRRQNAAAGQRRNGLITQTAMQDGEGRRFYAQDRRLERRGRRHTRRESIDNANNEGVAPIRNRVIALDRCNVVAPGPGAFGGRAGTSVHLVTGRLRCRRVRCALGCRACACNARAIAEEIRHGGRTGYCPLHSPGQQQHRGLSSDPVASMICILLCIAAEVTLRSAYVRTSHDPKFQRHKI